ncbi:hypothetical protein KAR91_28240 [Candidatus Pacearchaeota archaeon]|nr:hypothetical protein [Candidatus Pacearchaeota archaeon]
MSHREKKEKKPVKENISTQEAIRRLYNLTTVVMCNTCDKTDCVNRGSCGTYSNKPPECPTCGEAMDKKGDTFFCTACVLKEMKRKKLEGLS